MNRHKTATDIWQLDSLRWFPQRRSRTPHFRRCAARGLCPRHSNSDKIFVQCTYPQVSSSCVYSFGSYRVDKHIHPQTNKQTNKQSPLKTSNVLRYATTLGNHLAVCTSICGAVSTQQSWSWDCIQGLATSRVTLHCSVCAGARCAFNHRNLSITSKTCIPSFDNERRHY